MGTTGRDLTLGQRVTWNRWDELLRLSDSEELTPGGWHAHKVWRSHRERTNLGPRPEVDRTGVVVGLRILSNGLVRWTDFATEYATRETLSAVLVSYDLRRRPVLVRPEHVVPVR